MYILTSCSDGKEGRGLMGRMGGFAVSWFDVSADAFRRDAWRTKLYLLAA